MQTYTKQTYKINAKKPYLFIGSKIRGAFGYTLKEEVCINPAFECKGCFAANECLFYKLFEVQNTTHPYRLDFKLHSKEYKFSILLFGELQNHKELIHKAMMRSLEHYKKINFKEKRKKLTIKKTPKVIKIELLTPLRIKKENRLATNDIDLLDILLSIHRRKEALFSKGSQEFKIEKNYKIITKHLYFQDVTRRSNKQKTKMNLGGLMGEMVISDIDKQMYELLKLGEVIGVGKSTVFGLGKIKVKEIA